MTSALTSSRYRRFLTGLKARARSGNVAVTFAIATPLVVAAGGLGVETSSWYFKRQDMQAVADATAYAAGIEKRSGSTDQVILQVATQAAADNGFTAQSGTLQVNAPPTSGPNAGGQAVEVILSSPTNRYFSALFNSGQVTIAARSVALFNSSSNGCILALSNTAGNAVNFAGNTSVTLTHCAVMANSQAASAVNTQGSAVVSTDCMIAVGGVQLTGGVTLTNCPAPVTQAPRAGDPFANVPEPTATGCNNGNGGNLQPGRYCGGLTLKNNVTLNPGVYVIDGGDFKINANANITGTGVTIYMKGSGRISFNGNATINLSAPTSGTYAGILLMGDRTSLGGSNTINGTATSSMTGAVYFPTQAVDYLGNFSGSGGCVQVVADTIQWSGSTTVSADCTNLGMRPIPVMYVVKLGE